MSTIKGKLELDIEQFFSRLDAAEAKAAGSARRMRDEFGGKGQGGGPGSEMANQLLRNFAGVVTVAGTAHAAVSAFNAAVERESLVMGLAANSTENVEVQLARLKEVAKLPGLGMDEAIAGSTKLQAVGLSASAAEAALTEFGNGLALVGKGKADLDGVVLALTQMVGKGKVSAEEINQIAERMPQVRRAIEEAFGTSDSEALQKMGVRAEEFILRVTEALKGMPRAAQGTQLELENMQDQMRELQVEAGKFVSILAKPALGWLSDAAASLNDSMAGPEAEAARMSKLLGITVTPLDLREVVQLDGTTRTNLTPEEIDRRQREAEARKAAEAAEQARRSAQQRSHADQVAAEAREEKIQSAQAKKIGRDEQKRRREETAAERENAALRTETGRAAREMRSPHDQALELRQKLAEIFGVEIDGPNRLKVGFESLQFQANQARERGDRPAEKAALLKLRDAQQAAQQLAGLDVTPALQARGELARLTGQIFGRSRDDRLLDEATKQTRTMEKVAGVLREIKEKVGIEFSDF